MIKRSVGALEEVSDVSEGLPRFYRRVAFACSISERARLGSLVFQTSGAVLPGTVCPGADKVRYTGSPRHRSSWMRSSPRKTRARKPLRVLPLATNCDLPCRKRKRWETSDQSRWVQFFLSRRMGQVNFNFIKKMGRVNFCCSRGARKIQFGNKDKFRELLLVDVPLLDIIIIIIECNSSSRHYYYYYRV